MVRARWIVRGAAVAVVGAFAAACAALSGLDEFGSNAVCVWMCDASIPNGDGARADAPAAQGDAADATTADDQGEGTPDAPLDAGDSAANDGGEVPDSPGEDAATESGEGGCAAGWLSCGGGCFLPASPVNCGRCGNVCGAEGGPATCEPLQDTSSYVCVPTCPETAPALCDGGCFDTTSDPKHCGSCGTACAAGAAHSHPTCGDGGCGVACDDGFSACSGGCVSYTTAANCGSCGAACDPDGGTPLCAPAGADGGPYACSSGCPSTAPSRCSGGCTNTAVDLTNCGGCGQPCTTTVAHATPVCASSTCTFACNAGYTACGGACVDETSDPNNCGGCGVNHVCGLTQICAGGVCTNRCSKTSDCPAGYACNGTTCTTACGGSQPCNKGCCNGGTCTTGLAANACGTGGGACVSCSAQSSNLACINGSYCGCNVATDCAALNACSVPLHTCMQQCGGANTGCNGGCCTNISGGGNCVAGNADNQCGGTGGACSDCQNGCSPGPHCLANACACATSLDCLAFGSCSGRGICGDAGACHP